MLVRIWRFVTVMFAALSTSMAVGGHLLMLPARLEDDADVWRSTQDLYLLFGPPVGALIEGVAWVGAVVLAFLVRGRGSTFCWTVVGALAFVLAQVVWWALIFPVNQHIENWMPGTTPDDWMSWRAQWEYAHAARALLQIGGLAALVASILVEIPERS